MLEVFAVVDSEVVDGLIVVSVEDLLVVCTVFDEVAEEVVFIAEADVPVTVDGGKVPDGEP